MNRNCWQIVSRIDGAFVDVVFLFTDSSYESEDEEDLQEILQQLLKENEELEVTGHEFMTERMYTPLKWFILRIVSFNQVCTPLLVLSNFFCTKRYLTV